jgi:hypothetical protein
MMDGMWIRFLLRHELNPHSSTPALSSCNALNASNDPRLANWLARYRRTKSLAQQLS